MIENPFFPCLMKLLSLVVILVLALGCGMLFYQNRMLQSDLAALQSHHMANKEAPHTQQPAHVQVAQTAAELAGAPAGDAQPCSPPPDGEHPDYVQGAEAFHIEQAVHKKYEMLLDRLRVGRAAETQLLALLAQRERVLNATTHSYFTDALDSEVNIQERDAQLASLDDQIQSVLPPDNQDAYELLKDSEFEQYQLQEFDNNLPAEHFLSEQQSRDILLTKLRHKQEFSRAVQTASGMIKQGNRAGFDLFDQAIQSYKSNYLAEVQGELSEIQFGKLWEYEEKNFNEMRDSLRAAHLSQMEE